MLIGAKRFTRYVPYSPRLDLSHLGQMEGVEVLDWTTVSSGMPDQEGPKHVFKRVSEVNPRIQPGDSVWLRARRLKGVHCLFSGDVTVISCALWVEAL